MPLSLTGISVDTVPGVCPGVSVNVSVVSPSVSFWPSVTTRSRVGLFRFRDAAISSQSAADIRIFVPNFSWRYLRAAEMIEHGRG